MTEKSFLLPGSTVGDGLLAPMDSADLADWMYFAFEWCPSNDIADPSNFEYQRPDIFAYPLDGVDIPLRAVVLQYGNTADVNNLGVGGGQVLITVDTGFYLVDGRFLVSDNYMVFLDLPVAGTTYYTIGAETNTTAQTVRMVQQGPSVTLAGLTKIFGARRKSSSYFGAVCIVKCTPSTATLYDLRRVIRLSGTQIPRVVARQGGSATDWSVAGNTNYMLGDEVGIVPFQVGSTFAAGDSRYVVSNFPNSPIAIANGVGTDPKIYTTHSAVADRGNTEIYIVERDGVAVYTTAYGLIFGDRTIDQLRQSGYDPAYPEGESDWPTYDTPETSF